MTSSGVPCWFIPVIGSGECETPLLSTLLHFRVLIVVIRHSAGKSPLASGNPGQYSRTKTSSCSTPGKVVGFQNRYLDHLVSLVSSMLIQLFQLFQLFHWTKCENNSLPLVSHVEDTDEVHAKCQVLTAKNCTRTSFTHPSSGGVLVV